MGFVPEEFLQSEDVNIIDLKEKIPERNIVLIKRKEQPLSVAAKELERLIEGMLNGISEGGVPKIRHAQLIYTAT